jgi:virulence factor Mce-like protein
MRRKTQGVNPAVVGMVAAAVMLGLLIVAFANVSVFAKTTEVKALVSSADTLAPGGDVEVAGVKVGTVKSVDKGEGGALITMTVQSSQATLYQNATAAIRPHGVFGPKFIELAPGDASAGPFQSGGTIDAGHTSVSVDFEQVVNELNPDTRQSLQTALYELGKGSTGRGADFGAVIDNLKVVTSELVPPLQVVEARQTETGRFIEDSAVWNETVAASPLDSILRENNVLLTQLDAHNADIGSLVDHGNNVLADLDVITSGNNVVALRATLAKLPTLMDNLTHFSNSLGQATNALAPVVIPQNGQADGDIGLAIKRTQDAFSECDITSQNGSDTVHATSVQIVPCYGADGKPYHDASGHIAHHHVKVLLGVHTNSQPGNGEEEGNTLCGPNSGNATRASNPAFTCVSDPLQSAAIKPFGGPPPSASTAAAPTALPAGLSGVVVLEPAPRVNLLDLIGVY